MCFALPQHCKTYQSVRWHPNMKIWYSSFLSILKNCLRYKCVLYLTQSVIGVLILSSITKQSFTLIKMSGRHWKLWKLKVSGCDYKNFRRMPDVTNQGIFNSFRRELWSNVDNDDILSTSYHTLTIVSNKVILRFLFPTPVGVLTRKMYTPARTAPYDPYPYWHKNQDRYLLNILAYQWHILP